jgi:tRNA-dihydrouridine synthase
MNPFEILEELEKRKITVYLSEGKIKLKGEEETLTPELIDTIREHKPELMAFLSEREKDDDMTEWRKYARWYWQGVLDEAERQEDIKRMQYAQEVLKTIKGGN